MIAAWCLALSWASAAQPLNYSYDGSGNTSAAVPAGGGLPGFLTPPEAQVLQPNAFASFSVTASGSGISYQWLSNGIPILGATNDSLLIGNLILVGTNLGNFSVVLSNASGSVTSAPAALWPDSRRR